jgi:uncharacterized protein YhaN
MLVSVEMKKWRKHVDRTVNFTPGLNAIRGANENGKTTLLMAISYAFWGAKVLPLPMDEMVTWGFPVKDAKVSVILNKDGELYNFTRSSSGAECTHSGGIVTGQNEVSKFATELLGVSADLASKLMFASQGDLRGALKSGPTAIAEYIENMSGMDLFDRLMDLISEKLTTGPTTILDSAVADLEEKLEKGGPVPPDLTAVNTDIDIDTEHYLDLQGSHNNYTTAATEAGDTYAQAKAADDVREVSTRNLTRAKAVQATRISQKTADEALADTEVDEPRIEYLHGMIADARALQARKDAYKAFLALPVIEDEWAGDEASLKADIASAESRAAGILKRSNGLHSDIREARAKLTTSSVCGFCEQDLSKFPAVAAKNSEINSSIEKFNAELSPLPAQLADVELERDALKVVHSGAAKFKDFLIANNQYVEANNNFVPPRVTWVGEVPTGESNPAAMSAEMLKLKIALEDKVAAKTRLVQVTKQLEDDAITIQELEASIPEKVDLDVLYNAKFAADTQVADNDRAMRAVQTKIQGAEACKSKQLAEFELEKRNFSGVKVSLELKRKERDDLVFNNTLVKKIKSARPKVAAKLWSIVLTSVSTMFSNMRGEQSIVTKGPKGFLVNERPCEGLSGSALDLLGFAIRVSMLKTFIPDCSFLILDEATSACDDNRTASLLGFIAGAGFQQTLLVTHEEAAESVADNVVML